MVKQVRRIDVSGNSELLSLAENVAESGDSVLLGDCERDLATIEPAAPAPKHVLPRDLSPTELEAFNSSAGGWPDVDVEEFMIHVYEGRSFSKPRANL
jgi:hypothetical protein